MNLPPNTADKPLGTLVFPIGESSVSVQLRFCTNLSDTDARIIDRLIRSFADAAREFAPRPVPTFQGDDGAESLPTVETILKTPARPDGIKVEYHVAGIGKATDPFPNLNASLSKRDADFNNLPEILRDVFNNVENHAYKAPGDPVPVKAIAKRLGGLSQSYIRKCIMSLCELGWLRRTGRGKLEVAR